ncbi:MAG: molybdopterin-binding protein [Candidatus Nanopelagicales bacterium]
MAPNAPSDDGENSTAGALGLDGLLEWTQARFVARTAARALPLRAARLDEAHGSVLARALTSPYDEPFADAAAHDGYAVCGEGPWTIVELAHSVALSPHTAMRVRAKQILPGHTDAVLRVDRAVATDHGGTQQVTARDPLTDLPEATARPDFGEGIVHRGAIRTAGTELVHAHTPVSAAVLALAAAAGLDTVDVIPPPTVGTLVLGASLLTSGPPREGRVRDALGWTIPALVGSLGARANPPVRAPDTRELLMQEIDDANVDLLITTGSTSPDDGNILREALRDLGAHWLVDGIMATPGAQTLLVRLPDGRLLLGLPGQPTAALAGILTLGAPVIAGLRGDLIEPSRCEPSSVPPRAIITAPAPVADYDEDTLLCPVRFIPAKTTNVHDRVALPSATPLQADGPADLRGWAIADAIAVIPPGGAGAGDEVDLIDHRGRPATR